MKTLWEQMPEGVRKRVEAVRRAVAQRPDDGKPPVGTDTNETALRSGPVIEMLNGWLLDDEQKQALAQDGENLFYLYAAVYLCPSVGCAPSASAREEASATHPGTGRSPFRRADLDGGVRDGGVRIGHQWSEMGLMTRQQAHTLAAVCQAAWGTASQEPLFCSAGFPNRSYAAINIVLIAACLSLARSLDLKATATLQRVRDYMACQRKISYAVLASGFKVTAMGSHLFFPGTIRIRIHCRDPEIHRALKHHEQSMQRLLQRLNSAVTPRFLFSDILYEIEADGYTPLDMKFSVDSSAALQLFSGNRLYADKRAFLRELIQNAIDACHLKAMMNSSYAPEIVIAFDDHIRRVTVRDNGIGMDRQWLEKYFLKIGISFYQSDDIRRVDRDTRMDVHFISQFGIGFLSCFLVADKIVIRTRKPPAPGLVITITHLRDYFDVHFLEDTTFSGTEVTLHLKPSRINYCRSLEYVGYLKTNIRFLKVPVRLIDEKGRVTVIGKERLAYERDGRRGVDFVTDLDMGTSEGCLLLKAVKQTDHIQGVEKALGGIAVFQDGIFVTQLDSLLPEGARQNVIGRINLLGRERCELSMDRNRIFWSQEQLGEIKRRIHHGLATAVDQFMSEVEGQDMPDGTRRSIVNQLAVFFDIHQVDDAMHARLPQAIRAVLEKRFRDFIRIHYTHTRPSQGGPGEEEYRQRWQRPILESLSRKAG
jgi:hypothetical protein